MQAVPELATERVITLMTRTEKASLERKAGKSGVSLGEFVRRAGEAYNPEEAASLTQLAMLATELQRSNQETAAALDRALENAEATLAQLVRRPAA